jgi:UDP-3-O-[3-hydroxymyristoyl] glucosamine N-acyltransferase
MPPRQAIPIRDVPADARRTRRPWFFATRSGPITLDMTAATVAELAAAVNGRVLGDGELEIHGVGDVRFAKPDQIAFLRSAHLLHLARDSRAGAILVPEEFGLPNTQIVCDNPSAAFARVAGRFHPRAVATEHAIHPSAVVDPDATLEAPVCVGPGASIGARARIGAGTTVHAGAQIGERVRIGRECHIHPRVVVYPRCSIGDRVSLHSGTVIGADGFGYVPDDGQWIKVPQTGDVVIGDDVEVGANVAIDRGTIGSTQIGTGTKIDNLVHIAHNCIIGAHCVIAGLCALSGSTTLGDGVVLGGHTVSAGHLTIAPGTRIGGNSVLRHSVDEPGDYMGYPLQPRIRWGRTLGVLNRLAGLRRLAQHLERTDQRNEAERIARGLDPTPREE